MKIWMRKIKAKITGVTPCSFMSLHGHDFVMTSPVHKHNQVRYAFFECSVCKIKAEYNNLQGHFSIMGDA
jgi:hypothetical protein